MVLDLIFLPLVASNIKVQKGGEDHTKIIKYDKAAKWSALFNSRVERGRSQQMETRCTEESKGRRARRVKLGDKSRTFFLLKVKNTSLRLFVKRKVCQFGGR